MDFKIILPVQVLSSYYIGFPKVCRYNPMTQPGKLIEHHVELTLTRTICLFDE